MAHSTLALPFIPLRLAVSALSSPFFTGPVLFAILYHPAKLYSVLPVSLHKYITPGLIRALKVCFGLGVLQKANNKASELAINNWRSDGGFNKEKELVLITGGSSGIGLLIAKGFAEKGFDVVNFDLRPAQESLREYISLPFSPPRNSLSYLFYFNIRHTYKTLSNISQASNIYFYEVDVTSPEQISKAAAEVRKSHGEPTVLINNAGIGACRTILGGSEALIRKTFDVNNVSHFWMVREFLPSMIEKDHGHVVTVASMSSFIVPCQVSFLSVSNPSLPFH